MNLTTAYRIITEYNALHDFVDENQTRIWDIYQTAKSRAYSDEGETWHAGQRYWFERIGIETKEPYVVLERYCCGDTDYMDFPLSWFFNDNLEEDIYQSTREQIQERKKKKEAEELQEAEERKQREIAHLKKLKEKYPEV
jgi:hypothetical protein